MFSFKEFVDSKKKFSPRRRRRAQQIFHTFYSLGNYRIIKINRIIKFSTTWPCVCVCIILLNINMLYSWLRIRSEIRVILKIGYGSRQKHRIRLVLDPDIKPWLLFIVVVSNQDKTQICILQDPNIDKTN